MASLLLLGSWSLSSCGDDDPVTDDQEQVIDDDKDDNTDDEGKDDDGNTDPGEGDEDPGDDTAPSLYKPFETDKIVSHITIRYSGRTSDNDFIYDSEGRIIEQRTITNGKEETLVTKSFEYNGDFIDASIYPTSSGAVSDYILNEYGYVAEITSEIHTYPIIPIYDADNYWLGNNQRGEGQTLFYTDGNLTRDTSLSLSFTCTYTDHLNDTSIDLTTSVVRQAYDDILKTIELPTDIFGKRSRNLPAQLTFTSIDDWIGYDYEFDAQGRVTKILATYHDYNIDGEEENSYISATYEITYAD